MNDFLHHFEECIDKTFAVTGEASKRLIAEQETISIQIKSQGKYLLYEFDKPNKDIYPFFNPVPTLKIKADYLILKQHKGKIYALIVELKQKNGNPLPQIQATKHFVEYIIKCVSRVKKADYSDNLKLRGIKYSKLRKSSTAPLVEYDKFKNILLTGNVLNLELYLK